MGRTIELPDGTPHTFTDEELERGDSDLEPEGVMTQSKWVQVGSVRRFDHVAPDKAQALKPLEEAAEAFGAWQEMERELAKCLAYGNESSGDGDVVAMRECLLDECADVMQSVVDLVAALGVEDFRPYMKECERRNRERGRITDGKAVDE